MTRRVSFRPSSRTISGASEQLRPLVYDERRTLATQKMAREKAGQTLQAATLVHDAHMRPVDAEGDGGWNSRGHFFAAGAEAMCRILVDRARDKRRLKRGADRERVGLEDVAIAREAGATDLLALDEALAREGPACAELLKLRFFAGLTQDEAANVLGLTRGTANRHWAFARA